MPDYLEFDNLAEARRKGIEDSIHTITVEELKKLGEGLFPSVDHPWRERYFGFMSQNAGATFYHATTHDRVHVIYCPSKDQGMWFLPGSGMGPLQPKGLETLKEIVENL